MGQDEIKIRVVPRSTSAPKKIANGDGIRAKGWLPWAFMMGAAMVVIVALVLHFSQSQTLGMSSQGHVANQRRSVSAVNPEGQMESRIGESITRHMTDTRIRQEMMIRRQELDNAQLREGLEGDEAPMMAESSVVGPLMDHDKSSERVFEDLDLNSRGYTAISPHDKINARLASRKWLNEVERAERVNFVRTFVRSAYDRGYEVQLNENLVVIGVRKIQKDRKVTIDQIMDRMAKQGY
jgi:hypothetical protein